MLPETDHNAPPSEAEKTPFIPLDRRLALALEGWEQTNIEAQDLDIIADRVTRVYADFTFGDLYRDFSRMNRLSSNYTTKPYEGQRGFWQDRIIGSEFEGTKISQFLIDYDRGKFQGQPTRGAAWDLYHGFKFFPIGVDLFEFLKKSFQSTGRDAIPAEEKFARATYLANAINNPYLFISSRTWEFIGQCQQRYPQSWEDLDTNPDNQKLGYFMNEMLFTKNTHFMNDWGYAWESAGAYFRILDSAIGPQLLHDTLRFCSTDGIYLVSQFFAQAETIVQLYGGEMNYEEAFARFYNEHPEGLWGYFRGKPNIVISSMSRAYEDFYKAEIIPRKKGRRLMSVFSGPVDPVRLAGYFLDMDVITVDALPLSELAPIAQGGRAVITTCELLPGQHRKFLFHTLGNFPNRHQHITAQLPRDWPILESRIQGDIEMINDRRGSLLYLKGQELLEYLRSLYIFADNHKTRYLNFSQGLSRGFFVNFDLTRDRRGKKKRWIIEDIIPSATINDTYYLVNYGDLGLYHQNIDYSEMPLLYIIQNLINSGKSEQEADDYINVIFQYIPQAITFIHTPDWSERYVGCDMDCYFDYIKIAGEHVIKKDIINIILDYFWILIREGDGAGKQYTDRLNQSGVAHKRFLSDILRDYDQISVLYLINATAYKERLSTHLQAILAPEEVKTDGIWNTPTHSD